MNLIFNNNQPMYSPSLTNFPATSETERMSALAEIDLLETSKHWNIDGDLADGYKELAMIYTSIYDDKVAASNLLLTFQAAVVKMEVERKTWVQKKGAETESSTEAYRRNQFLMHVHQFASALLEKNNQLILLLKNNTDKLIQYQIENRGLKQQLNNIQKAENF